jgi:beta-barrel assembly-enhancing protease
MSGFFYNLGKMVGPHERKAKWAWLSATGTEAETIKVEYEVGCDLTKEIRRQLTPDPDPRAVQVLTEIGSKLSARIANQLHRFTFEAVKNGPPNAFALPGGFVFVTRALLELCEWNQDEVAFILAHEMSHVIRGHAMDRIVSNSAIAIGTRASPIRGVLGSCLQKVGVTFLQSAYSQDTERESDTLGVLLADAAGYDGRAAIQLLTRLAELRNPQGQSDLSVYFSSHPAFEQRSQNILNVLKLAKS